MVRRMIKNPMALLMIGIILFFSLAGIFAPIVAPNDPLKVDIMNKFMAPSARFPFGTDHLGRCILSRLIYGVRPTLLLSLITMFGTLGIGSILGLSAGFLGGGFDRFIMRWVDIMLAFPSQIMVLAVVALLGANVTNVIIANVFIKWAWYARMIRSNTLHYKERNFILFSKCIGSSKLFIIFRHLLPSLSSEMVVLATLDIGWAILNISTLSFLGLGVQPPTPEWGAMLNEAKNVLTKNPTQMLAPGLAIVLLVAAFNFLGDALRDALDPKEAKGS